MAAAGVELVVVASEVALAVEIVAAGNAVDLTEEANVRTLVLLFPIVAVDELV